mmetsp:Transcript_60463/g.148352  ORF Transcript_60463/g.148352 Transcript_60463/m.148352 type:complete len:535 (-) Transcript_60463:1133-2737(-)
MMETMETTTKATTPPLRRHHHRGRQGHHSHSCRCTLDSIFLLMVVMVLLSSVFTIYYHPSLQRRFVSTYQHPILLLLDDDDQPVDTSSRRRHSVSSSSSSFAACLLTMEDDFVLPEWIAYHYTRLPLRRLIVAIDPRSRTRPTEILERWNDLIKITVWNDTQFFPLSYRLSIMENPNNKTLSERHTLMHRFRQRFFYMHCLQQVKREYQHDRKIQEEKGDQQTPSSSYSSIPSPTWVVLIDSDEFLQSPNPNWKHYPWLVDQTQQQHNQKEEERRKDKASTGISLNGSHLKSKSSDWTVLELLDRLQLGTETKTGPLSSSSVCIGLPRLLFGTKKNSHDQKEEGGDDQHHDLLATLNLSSPDLMTFQWIYHGKLIDTKVNRVGKSMINLKNVPYDSFSFRNTDIHRPLLDYCTEQDVWIQNVDSPFIVRHYIGTFRQWSSRADARKSRNKERYDSFKQLDTYHDISVIGWVEEFVHAVGISKARSLLSGSGVVPQELFDSDTTNPPLLLDEELKRSQQAFNISPIRPLPSTEKS